jgi:hypothetical protein
VDDLRFRKVAIRVGAVIAHGEIPISVGSDPLLMKGFFATSHNDEATPPGGGLAGLELGVVRHQPPPIYTSPARKARYTTVIHFSPDRELEGLYIPHAPSQ